ncbi:hypothetical protein PTKIN_Ptkin19aG0009000 [Pterospermum kingtungense]
MIRLKNFVMITYNELKSSVHSKDWRIFLVIKDIVKMRAGFDGFRCSWVSRKANVVVDWLSQLVKKGMCSIGRVLIPPSSLVHILDKDGLPAPPL